MIKKMPFFKKSNHNHHGNQKKNNIKARKLYNVWDIYQAKRYEGGESKKGKGESKRPEQESPADQTGENGKRCHLLPVESCPCSTQSNN